MKNKYRKEHAKNLVIFLLSLSLLALTAVNWLYDRAGTNETFAAAGSVPEDYRASAFSEPTRPVTVLISKAGQLYGAGSGDEAVGAVYDRFKTLLGESLASASGRRTVGEAEWNSALAGDCVSFDFLSGVPAWALSEGISFTASPAIEDVTLKSFILSPNTLLVYTGREYISFDADMEYYAPEQLEGRLYAAEFVNGSPVFERDNAHPGIELSDRFMNEQYRSEILTAMGFNPNTNFRYPQADGDIVFVDDRRTLRISRTGLVSYHDGTEYPESQLSVKEALKKCMDSIPQGGVFWGDGRLLLDSIEQWEDSCTFEFIYTLNGAVFDGGSSVFVIEGDKLTEARLQLFPASYSETEYTLLPMRQAALITAEGRRLYQCYSRSGDGEWIPQWYAR